MWHDHGHWDGARHKKAAWEEPFLVARVDWHWMAWRPASNGIWRWAQVRPGAFRQPVQAAHRSRCLPSRPAMIYPVSERGQHRVSPCSSITAAN